MTITLNGRAREFAGACSLATLLQELALADKPVVVELNGTAILKTDYPETTVTSGDRLEIITLAAGG